MKSVLILACLATALHAEEKPATIGDEWLTWHIQPPANPVGGAKFASSAFIHPLKTPSGFVMTNSQPSDHLHHFGLWWPWKFVRIDGTQFNTWEIQEGQGGHAAVEAAKVSTKDGVTTWELKNRTTVKPKDGEPFAAIEESTTISSFQSGSGSTIIDIEIRQQATDKPVEIVNYRYSGFTWRGPAPWNKDNSVMITSGGKDRENANGTEARWVVVHGEAPAGRASMLLMSAASTLAGTEEKVRVWDSRAHHGAPFVNFNPVMGKPLLLDPANKAVTHRKYRLIAADHEIDAATAESEWKRWTSGN